MVTYVFALWETQVMTKQKIGIRDKKNKMTITKHTHTHTHTHTHRAVLSNPSQSYIKLGHFFFLTIYSVSLV